MFILGKSVRGKRDYNQDSIYHGERNGCFIMAVADGVGGSSGGDIASGIVTDVCQQLFEEFSDNPSRESLKSTVQRIAEISSSRIREETERKPEYNSMATTLTVAAGYGQDYVVGNIGDSRTYLISEGSAEQITEDHTYIKEIENKYNEQIIESLREEMGHVITRSVSREQSPIDIFPDADECFALREGDTLLLCSDGMIPDQNRGMESVFSSAIRDSISIEEALDRLIEWALENGSLDNISVVIGKNANRE